MKNFSLNNICCYLLVMGTAMLFFLMASPKKSYGEDINTVRAFAGFIKYIYLNVDTVNNGDNFCVIGSDDISIQIKSMFTDNNLFQELNEEIDRGRSYHECRVVYVARSKEKELKYVTQFFADAGALTIGVFPSFVLGGGMLSVEIGRRNFELTANELMIKETGISIDSSIASLVVR